MKKLILLMSFLMFINMSAFGAKKVAVKLLKVYDGDTVQVETIDNKIYNVRLVGIDCFETSNNNRAYKQAYENKMTIEQVVAEGMRQKLALISYIKENYDNQMYLEDQGIDKYGRVLGIIYLGKTNINQYMLKSKNALKYDYFDE